jgi:hypothetical protein
MNIQYKVEPTKYSIEIFDSDDSERRNTHFFYFEESTNRHKQNTRLPTFQGNPVFL